MNELNLNSEGFSVNLVLGGRLDFDSHGAEKLRLSSPVSEVKFTRSKFDVETILTNLRADVSFVIRVLSSREISFSGLFSILGDNING